MHKKDIAILFLKMAGSGDVKAAYEKFIAPDFIHHNQYFKGDRQSLLSAMEKAHETSPNKRITILKAVEEGETVMTFSRVERADPTASDIAVVHIFRFKNDLVVELWDLGQAVSKDSPNENGAF